MAETDSVSNEQIRPMQSSAPRPPFQPPSQQMRPQMGPPGGGPSTQQRPPGPGMNAQQRPMPPPLRRVDSKGNPIVSPGQQPRPPQQNQPIRPPPSGGGEGSMSPPGQGASRPQGAFQWAGAGAQQSRPPNSFGNPQPGQGGRPFPRPGTVGPGGQPQFRPPYPQQNLQHPQQQQQQLGPQQPHPPQQRTFAPQSHPVTKANSHEDDDSDVVFGQAVTPLKMPPSVTSPNRNGNIAQEIKTAPPAVQQQQENHVVPPRSTTFAAELNGKDNLRDIEEETPAHTAPEAEHVPSEDKQKPNELMFGPAEPSYHSAKLTNFQKISGDLTETPRKSDKPAKPEKPPKAERPPKPHKQDEPPTKGDNDSGVDESTQEKERNGPTSPSSPAKTPTKPTTGISRPPSATPSNKSNKSRSTSRNRLALKTPEPEPSKKVPMNKVQVGNAPSPNLKAVRSKIGSLDNATYKPGGGKVKIESKKIEIKAAPRIEAKNEKYTPKGGDKKIVSTKLQWNAKSKIGSLENANHKPGGGDKKIDTIKTDFKDKAKPKVGSKDNVKHAPGGGDIKKDDSPKDIQTHKIEIKAQSKVGSLDNVKHKPGGGDKKIFDDKDYLKNIEHPVALTSPSQTPQPSSMTTSITGADENLNQQQQQQQQQQLQQQQQQPA